MGIPIAVEPLVARVVGFDIGEVHRIEKQLQRILQNMVLIRETAVRSTCIFTQGCRQTASGESGDLPDGGIVERLAG